MGLIEFTIGLWRKLFTKTKTNEIRAKMEKIEITTAQPEGADLKRMCEIALDDIFKMDANIVQSELTTPLIDADKKRVIGALNVEIPRYRRASSVFLDNTILKDQVSSMRNFSSHPYVEVVSGKSEEEIRSEVIKALENKNFDWRSIDGIVRETHLPKEEVSDMIKQLIKEGLVVRAPYLDKKSNRIYTTRKHYHETVGFVGRLISAMTNRII